MNAAERTESGATAAADKSPLGGDGVTASTSTGGAGVTPESDGLPPFTGETPRKPGPRPPKRDKKEPKDPTGARRKAEQRTREKQGIPSAPKLKKGRAAMAGAIVKGVDLGLVATLDKSAALEKDEAAELEAAVDELLDYYNVSVIGTPWAGVGIIGAKILLSRREQMAEKMRKAKEKAAAKEADAQGEKE